MGGAGGTVYEIDNTRRSGAFLASNIVISFAENYFINFKEQGLNLSTKIQENVAKELKYHFNKGLQQILDKIDKTGNVKLNIKSKLIKRLPTTLALCSINHDENEINIYNYWAGDSRIYSLDSNIGLHQLTDDNLVNHTDAFDNLINDSKISNCINADSDYNINFNSIKLKSPQIIIASTDGAFGYLPTPVHFEHLLLDSLIHSNSINDWKKNLIESLKNNQSDDISLSISILGYKSFHEIKTSFNDRFSVLDNDISNLNNLFLEMNYLESQLRETNEKNKKTIIAVYDYDSKINAIVSKSNELQDEINNLKIEIYNSEDIINIKLKEIEQIRNNIRGYDTLINKLSHSLNETKNERDFLNNQLSILKKQNSLEETDSLHNRINSLKEIRSVLNKDLWLKYKSQYEKYLKSR